VTRRRAAVVARRVLVIDDDPAARYVAHRTLEALTDDVFEADSASTGVVNVLEAPLNGRPA
jgi:CheY-like chemotaxis protein